MKGVEKKPTPSRNRPKGHSVESVLCPETFPERHQEPGEEARAREFEGGSSWAQGSTLGIPETRRNISRRGPNSSQDWLWFGLWCQQIAFALGDGKWGSHKHYSTRHQDLACPRVEAHISFPAKGSIIHPCFWTIRKLWSMGLHLNLPHNFFNHCWRLPNSLVSLPKLRLLW